VGVDTGCRAISRRSGLGSDCPEESKVVAEEEKAVRETRAEIAKVPRDPGVYYVEGNTVKSVKVAESKVPNNKGRTVLQVLSPIPAVSAKANLELDGLHAQTIFTNPEQEFYIQLSAEERFGIVQLTPAKRASGSSKRSACFRSAKEVVEEPIEVQVFQKQMTQDGLYKLWPMKPMGARRVRGGRIHAR
jgi:hypothetical protein